MLSFINSFGPLGQQLDIIGTLRKPASINVCPGSSQSEVDIKSLDFLKYLNGFDLKPNK